VAAVGASVLFFPGNVPLLVGLLAAVYAAMGLATAALYAHLMDLTDPVVAATQFGVFMGGINLCYVWATTLVGTLIDLHGYGLALIAMAGCSLVALPLLRLLPKPADEGEEPVS
jgi:MFS family permease